MSTTREQAGPSKPSGSASGEKEKDDLTFECNICLDPAKDAVVSLCGHLFCWPCLHQWLETCRSRTGQYCPVCKASISKEKVIPLYGRGATKDPRNNIPPRPSGQRTEPESNIGFSSFGFGEGSYMSFGIGTFPFAFFTSPFNFGETRPNTAPRGSPQYEEEQFLSKIFLWLALILICWLLMA